jgi:SEC-C motif-containing protein
MTAKLGPSKPCPCTSGKSYGDCCRPLHRNEKEAETAEALMRSRYAAFALGEVAYLMKTHVPDDGRSLTESELREACRARFLGLRVLEAKEENGATAVVRFHARVFSGGTDRSFEETSEFRRIDRAWRYTGQRD